MSTQGCPFAFAFSGACGGGLDFGGTGGVGGGFTLARYFVLLGLVLEALCNAARPMQQPTSKVNCQSIPANRAAYIMPIVAKAARMEALAFTRFALTPRQIHGNAPSLK